MSDVVLMDISIRGLTSVDVHAETLSEELSDLVPLFMLEVQY